MRHWGSSAPGHTTSSKHCGPSLSYCGVYPCLSQQQHLGFLMTSFLRPPLTPILLAASDIFLFYPRLQIPWRDTHMALVALCGRSILLPSPTSFPAFPPRLQSMLGVCLPPLSACSGCRRGVSPWEMSQQFPPTSFGFC